jgi:hypothetical protein
VIILRFYLNLPFSNETLKDTVGLYCNGNYYDLIRTTRQFGPISFWNVSEVTDMSGLFGWKHQFNEPLEEWDVSHNHV